MYYTFSGTTSLLRTIVLIFLIYSLISVEAFGQGNFLEGYIITNQNDTIKGTIRHAGWTESPLAIQFKAGSEIFEQRFTGGEINGFSFFSSKETYKSKKIGLLNISLDQVYSIAPSIQAKDSAKVFLQEIVSGEKASLYEYIGPTEEPHYFIEKDHQLTELYNYPFYKEANGKKYLLVYDDYKRQLANLSGDAQKFTARIPVYQEKQLRQYIEKYNQSFSGSTVVSRSSGSKLTFDLDMNLGLENWKEPGFIVKNKLTYGIGLRMNLPGKFQNRFFKLSFFMTPNLTIPTDYNTNQKISLKTFEVATGSHIGSGNFRPYVGFHYSGVYRNYRTTFLGIQGGISYKRRINLEIGHFANFYSLFSESSFFMRPRISLHYMLNLNDLFKK